MVWDDKQFVANKIKYYRKKANMTQNKLAELIDISPKQMSRIEVAAYTPSLSTFLKIVKVLKIDLSEFGLEFSNENKIRDEFIKLIYQMNDKELKLCHNVILNVLENLKEINF